MHEYVSQRAKYLVGVIYDYFEKQFFPIELVIAAVLPISILARFFTG